MTMTMTEKPSVDAGLRTRWQALRETEPGLRIRDAADRLGVSEAELLATRQGDGVTRLQRAWGTLIERLPEVGEVMVLTRNDHAVHEKVGRFGKVSIRGPMGLVFNREVDLRLFLGRWAFGFAVTEEAQGATRHSLQFFDTAGAAVHKVYRREASDGQAWERLVDDFAHGDGVAALAVEAPAAPATDRPDTAIDRAALRARWEALQDVHDFRAMLDVLEVGRLQAFRLIGDDMAWRVAPSAFQMALERAAASALSIMVFVGNPGTVQIHTGPVSTLKTVGPWFNVLDPGFNLHLREDGIAEAWAVRKPTRDGIVTSLEIFDAASRQIAWMFGERREGDPESSDWRALLGLLPEAAGPESGARR